MTGAGPRVVLADGREAARIGMRIALEDEGCAVVASEPDVDSVVAAAQRERPQVCLIDVTLPGGGGVAATSEIKAVAPDVRILVLSTFDCDDLVCAMLNAGAHAAVRTDIEPSRLAAAVRAVADGESVLPSVLVARLVAAYCDESGHDGRSLIGRLTEREREIVEILLEHDAGTGDVAHRLGVSPVTVRRHISGIVRKSGTTGRAAALSLARSERDCAAALAGVQPQLNANRC